MNSRSLFTLIILILSASITFGETKNILIFHSYNPNLQWVKDINNGIQDGLKSSDYHYELFYEFLDTKRIINFNYLQNLSDFYKIKYSEKKIDLIITCDNDAFFFIKKYSKEIFNRDDFIFCGLNGLDKNYLDKITNSTGIVENLYVKENIDLILNIIPSLKEIYFFYDNSEISTINSEIVKKLYKNNYYKKVIFRFIENKTFEEAFKIVSEIPQNSAILLIGTLKDNHGHYVESQLLSQIFSQEANSPVFGLWDFYLNAGIVGGYVCSGYEQGLYCSDLAVKFFSGIPINKIPKIYDYKNSYKFDYNLLKKFNINSKLPVSSMIINKPHSFIDDYTQVFIYFLIILSILLFIVIFLLVSRYKIKKNIQKINIDYTFIENIIENANIIVILTDTEGNVLYFNKTSEKITGYKREELLNSKLFEKIPFLSSEKTSVDSLNILFEEEIEDSLVIDITTKKGFKRSLMLKNAMFNQNSSNPLVIINGCDVTEKVEFEEKLKHLSFSDPLTGLVNKKYIDDLFLESNFINRNKNFSMLMFDIDHFKFINNIYGHESGDKLLVDISRRLGKFIDETSIVSRYGGDSFLIISTKNLSKDNLLDYIRKLFDEFINPFSFANNLLYMTISVGIVQYPLDGQTYVELINNLELALQKAKEIQNNSYEFYNDEMSKRIFDSLYIRNNLKNGIFNSEMEIYYQPIINLEDNSIVNCEALVRWHHPELGLLTPDKFIHIAETTGNIYDLGKYIINKVFNQSFIWKQKGINIPISINLSTKQFFYEELKEYIYEQEKIYEINPSSIAFEINEDLFMDFFSRIQNTLFSLKDKGYKFYLDNFGIGYSSLNHITQIEFEYIKIDRSLIKNYNSQNTELIKTIKVLTECFNTKAIVEGIEHEKELEIIKNLNYNLVQGFYFSKPLNSEEFEIFYNMKRGDNNEKCI